MIKLKTFNGAENTPEDDSAIYKKTLLDGILQGCEIFKSGDNTVNISDGYILFKGRNIQIVSEHHQATLATSDTKNGYVYLKLDLNNVKKPLEIKSEIEKTEFTENEFLLATYTATALTIDNLKRVCYVNLEPRETSIQVVKNTPPTENDDKTKNFIVGDTWTVPSITFNNLVNLKEENWSGCKCNVKKSVIGLDFIENESGDKKAYAMHETGKNIKSGHKYYVFANLNPATIAVTLDAISDYCTLKIYTNETILYENTVASFKSDIGMSKYPNISNVFTAPDNISGTIKVKVEFENKDRNLNGDAINLMRLYLINLTEDMGAGYEFTESQCDDYFPALNDMFQTKPYEKNGVFQCLNNTENGAVWGEIADYPIECGTSGRWTYKKMASGEAECFACIRLNNVKLTREYRNGFVPKIDISYPLPFNFTSGEKTVVSIEYSGTIFNSDSWVNGRNINLSMWTPTRRDNTFVDARIIVKGYWK